ncbi:MAG: MFS transporter [Clostridia bacterium]|nr:MFS transporter [Clostridia bacterium]
MFNIIILGLVSLLTDVSTEMVYPLIPIYLTAQLGATPAIVGIIEGIAESLASLLKVFSGYWSDLAGRRKPLAIAGYSFSTIGKVLLYFSGSWPMVLWGRIADRFGKGIRTAPRDALIAESGDSQSYGRSFGLHRAMDTLGAAIGVVLAYYFLVHYQGDYRRVFLYALVPAALGVITLFFARERRPLTKLVAGGNAAAAVKAARSRPNLNWRALDPRLKAFLVVVFIFTLGNSSNQFLLLRAKTLNFSDVDVILLYLTYNLVYSLASYPAGRLSDRIGRRAVLVTGFVFYGLVYLGFAITHQPMMMWVLFSAYGLYSAFTEGVEKALVADIAPEEQRATLIGLHATLVGIGLLPASMLAGLLWDLLGAAAPFYFGSIMGLVAAAGMWIVLAVKPKSQGAQ